MNDEIKEILDELKYISNDIKVHIQDENIKAKEIPSSMVKELRLNSYSAKLLLDCITNLQQIEQDHQKLNGELREELEYYKSRCEKAMELLKEFYDSGSCPLRNISKAYEILNGDDKDVKD